jgi:bifunctional non-homologous end joining protein LigD
MSGQDAARTLPRQGKGKDAITVPGKARSRDGQGQGTAIHGTDRFDRPQLDRYSTPAAIPPGFYFGARKKPLPREPTPRLATLGEEAPAGDDWLHELKFDGYRLLARLKAGGVRLLTRSGQDWSDRFPVLCDHLASLPVTSALLNGELVALDADGISRFGLLQEALGARRTETLVYQVFDLLYLEGFDLKQVALAERKQALADLLGDDPPQSVRIPIMSTARARRSSRAPARAVSKALSPSAPTARTAVGAARSGARPNAFRTRNS